MPSDREFGHWTNLEERVEELHNRLVAWNLTVEDQFAEVWTEAYNRFNAALSIQPNPLESPPIMLVEAFEGALSAFDAIWMQSMEMARDMGDVFNDDEEG